MRTQKAIHVEDDIFNVRFRRDHLRDHAVVLMILYLQMRDPKYWIPLSDIFTELSG